MRIETNNLPSQELGRLHADFLANEQAYLRMRSALLATYRGQWVAVADDKVLAAGSPLLEVMDRPGESTAHSHVALVGAEDEAVFRVRRVAFAYQPVSSFHWHASLRRFLRRPQSARCVPRCTLRGV
jgi:hypothetical protein